MKVVRTIIYEGTEERLITQLKQSLPDGEYPSWCTHITVITTSPPISKAIDDAIAENHGGWQGNLEVPDETSN